MIYKIAQGSCKKYQRLEKLDLGSDGSGGSPFFATIKRGDKNVLCKSNKNGL